MFILIIIMVLMLITFSVFALMMIKTQQSLKKLNAELHDRYSLLWADYTRRGQRISLYEAGMTKESVDALDRQVLARAKKFAINDAPADV